MTAGSDIPVYRICVGTGPKQVRLKDLRQTIIKKRTYIPSPHKNALMRKLRPRTRFMMSKDQLTTLNERLHTLQRKNGSVCLGFECGHGTAPFVSWLRVLSIGRRVSPTRRLGYEYVSSA